MTAGGGVSIGYVCGHGIIGRRFSAGTSEQKGMPVPEGRREAADYASVHHEKARRLVAFLSKPGIQIIFRLDGSPPALRDGADLISSATGAEALAYYQGVPPGTAHV
jgi:hypothetical protein